MMHCFRSVQRCHRLCTRGPKQWSDYLTPRRPYFSTETTQQQQPHLLFNPMLWYSKVIDSHPLIVKCTTACAVSFMGDVASQKLQGRERLDWAQTARFAGMNLLVVGPTLHYWYIWLAQRYPGTSFLSVAKRVFWDEFIFTPICKFCFRIASPPSGRRPTIDRLVSKNALGCAHANVTHLSCFILLAHNKQTILSF